VASDGTFKHGGCRLQVRQLPTRGKPVARKKLSPRNHKRLHVAGTCRIRRLFDPEIGVKIRT
jgi:hypothetical protein